MNIVSEDMLRSVNRAPPKSVQTQTNRVLSDASALSPTATFVLKTGRKTKHLLQ